MKLKTAEEICEKLLNGNGELAPHFSKYLVCGSIRRKCENVHDIDIVAIMKPNLFGEPTLSQRINLIDPTGSHEAQERLRGAASRFLDGPYIKRFKFKNMMIDIYLTTEELYETLILIRTGSKEHNIRLTTLARGKQLKLFASGKGLCKIKGGIYNNEPEEITEVIEDTEDGILQNLLGRVPLPEKRN